MQRISIVIVGASHRDPGPLSMLRLHANELRQRDIPLIFCAELPCDQTLNEKQMLDKLNLNFAYRAMSTPAIQSLLQRNSDHVRPYFEAATREKIEAALPAILANLYSAPQAKALSSQSHLLAKYILNYLAIEESIKLDSEVQTFPYQGIEQPMQAHSENITAFKKRPGFFAEIEGTRCEEMAKKICRDAVAKAKGNDAIIFCQVGALHAQRLAAAVTLYAGRNLMKSDVKVVPMYAHSNYCADIVDRMKSSIFTLQNQDSQATLFCYTTFATPVVTIEEFPDKMAFKSEGFDQMIDIAVSHIDIKKSYLNNEAKQRRECFLVENDIGIETKADNRYCPSCTLL